MRKSTFGFAAFATVAALGMGVGQASDATLVADGFSYADGQLTDSLHLGVPGDNVSGGLWVGHSGTTFDDNIQVAGGQAILNNPGSEDANRLLGTTLGAADTLYYATKFTVDSLGTNNNVNDDYFIHFKDAGFGFVGRVSVRDTATGDYQLGIQAGSNFGTNSGVDLTFGTEHTAVVKWDNATGTATLWVDPVDELSASVSHTDANRIGTSVVAIALRQDFFTTGGVDSNTISVNGVGVATTFGEAFAASMVPEPASLALLGLGGLAMLRRRTA